MWMVDNMIKKKIQEFCCSLLKANGRETNNVNLSTTFMFNMTCTLIAEGFSDFTDTDELVPQVSLGSICSLRKSQADPSILFAAYNARQGEMR